MPNINPPLLSGVCNTRRLLILQVKEQREIFTQNIVHSQKWVQPGLTSTLAWFQGTGYFFQTLVSPEAVLGHSHLRVGLNVPNPYRPSVTVLQVILTSHFQPNITIFFLTLLFFLVYYYYF